MNDIDSAVLARTWWHALVTGGVVATSADHEHPLLSHLIDEMVAALDLDPFDPDAGLRAGIALWAAGLTDQRVPPLSAQVLSVLADSGDHPDAGRRTAGLMAALGQGHQRERSERDTKFRVLFDNSDVAVAIGNTDGIILEANRALADMIGVPEEGLRGISVFDFAHPDDRENIRILLYEKLVPARRGTVALNQRLVRADGTTGWMTFAVTFVGGVDGGPDYLLAIGGDDTERRLRQKELRRQAEHDSLTGLPNRRYLLERIGKLIAAADTDDRAGLCFADLDHFKQVNDRYGHGAGDKVLVAVAERLHETVHGDRCFACRLGGDEFVVLISPPTDADEVGVIADQLLSVFVAPVIVDGFSIDIAASIGAVVTPLANTNAELLLHAADTNLRDAKTNSKGRWVMRTPRNLD